ncbi:MULTISPECIES: diacylglycerol/lipid kinase family protein [Atopobiaceae]|uniref:Diacylglycerol kinase family enzyme n=1 Tax=Parafannyhessea umbonata TaxID=604330 RepID=A0A1H6JE06_9ACTN|nr:MULTISPECIES: diacylglycerol kinase family protein [Atopobiaceae]SEH58967.1 Diacylglycerol kinase family enzyme [Parafannyhessea umbonata]SJZ52544.1 Diacylglycerol kinase family enzyme [Olsenella sp. KH1P3]
MRTLIVHNTKSGFGSDAIFEFERALVRQGDECVLRVLPDDSGATEAVADAEDFDLVVVSGGDGTVANLLYALRFRGVRTCIFPSGTANLIFGNLGCASEPWAIAESCVADAVAETDLGEISWVDGRGLRKTRGFALMAGSGFDATLMKDAIPNKRTMGEAAYFAAALANAHPKVVTYDITVDGRTFRRRGIACIVANNATMQGDIDIVSNCTMADGLLDVIVLATTDAVQLLMPMLSGIFDKKARAGRPFIEHFVGKSISVRSSSPMPMQVDGDVVTDLTMGYEAHALPGANQLVVDANSPYRKKGTVRTR